MARGLLLGTLELETSAPRAVKRAVAEPVDPGILKAEDVLHWFNLPGPPKDWQYAFIDDAILTQINDGEECYALTMPSLGLVLFAKSLMKRANRPVLEIVFFHEGVHQGCSNDGGAYTVKLAFGAKSHKSAMEREEALAGLLSNNLAPPLFRAGIMRLPRLPAMRR